MERVLAGLIGQGSFMWTGEEFRPCNVPDDVLVQELIRRQRIKWFQTGSVVSRYDLDLHFTDTRASIIQTYRRDMMHRLAGQLLDENIAVFNQAHDNMTNNLCLRLSLPVFIRT